ncbi:RING-H2 finger protein ATL74 [Brachypodium distachyon]|uniref:RING-type domain-containing protein n=1 Tax=Brachypodium distachyon TaxID=15368 RepID=A0A0Q3H288_BRADI|nr:RING-H2 finger protein ATL74 [Brachypodium distachyon]KQK17031.1 hypothetical protein BRADI_1g32080v3 [Brachypodium distachyon]|eukprot:XP_010240497.1 RING-H2 finger protein ATL74 [Brachypodium distachyon]
MEASHMSNCTGSVSATPSPAPTPMPTLSPSSASSALDYGVAVILAAMLCTLVCALGLNSVFHHCVARCCSRRLGLGAHVGIHSRGAIATTNNAGLKRGDALLALPVSTYHTAHNNKQQQQQGSAGHCAICLSDFADGETVRALPVCGHGFHVACVDRWLVSRFSCPTCRRRLSDNVSAGGAGDGEEEGGRRAGRDNQLQVLAAV